VCQGGFSTRVFPQYLGFGGGLFSRGAGKWGIDVGRGVSTIGEGSSGRFELLRAHRFPPPPIAHLCLRLKVSLPGVLGVSMKVIVVHGD